MSVNLEIMVGRPWHGLGAAYARGEEAALHWYPADWRDPDAWRARARVVGGQFDKDSRARAVSVLGAPTEEVRFALDRVIEEEGFLITTGQQPGLFTGPLYTIYKALSAVALARSLERVLGAPVVPVFWISSDDHDWAEVDHADLIGVDNELHRVQVTSPERAGEMSLHRLPVGSDIEAAVAEMAELLPQTEFATRYIDLLRGCWRAGVTLPDGVRATLEEILGQFGMAFVDAADPKLKAESRGVIEYELRSAEEHEQDLRARAGELHAAGWSVQVPVLPGSVNLFIEGPAGRERLYCGDGEYRVKSGSRFSLDDVLERLREDPQSVSPNVLLRPVVEAATLPTLGYVSGPAETAYLAQLAPLFVSHGVSQPIVFPRFSATMVERKVGKVLEKLSLEVAGLVRPLHEIAGDLAREDMPQGVKRSLGEIRETLDREGASLVDAALPVDPTLKGPIEHAR
ncbi:MAG TPA: bacillithiol biosynthesis cysteine-adding enzyme BshC, partial [Gemmatimonadetes bacterium]|nr:bacillithiol biosynthesis cysteine-adding enzyme BshC [Gemmatimonadota bacterium]